MVAQRTPYRFEYLASFDNDNRIPNHDLKTSLSLTITETENSVLEITAFRNIAAVSQTVNTIIILQ